MSLKNIEAETSYWTRSKPNVLSDRYFGHALTLRFVLELAKLPSRKSHLSKKVDFKILSGVSKAKVSPAVTNRLQSL